MFSRPEDGPWDPANPRVYYFVTTDQLDRVTEASASRAAAPVCGD
jgi:hypothetical protein